MKKKIAILFWGIPRRIDLTIGSLETNVFDVLRAHNYEITTFFHSFVVTEKLSNKRSREKGVSLDPAQYKLLNANFFEYDVQHVVAKQLDLPRYRKMGNPWSGKSFQSLDNFILSSYSKYRVTQMMQNHGQVYDYVLYIRPDLKILCPFPVDTLQLLNQSTSGVLVANFHLFGPYRINDRFAGCSWHNYQSFGCAFEGMYHASKTMVMHSETYIGKRYSKMGVRPIYIEFYFNRVRANGFEEKDHVTLESKECKAVETTDDGEHPTPTDSSGTPETRNNNKQTHCQTDCPQSTFE